MREPDPRGHYRADNTETREMRGQQIDRSESRDHSRSHAGQEGMKEGRAGPDPAVCR